MTLTLGLFVLRERDPRGRRCRDVVVPLRRAPRRRQEVHGGIGRRKALPPGRRGSQGKAPVTLSLNEGLDSNRSRV